VFSPNFTRPAAAGLRLYVYELPTNVAFDFESAAAFEFDAGFAWHHPNYIAYKHFKSMLMKDWAVRCVAVPDAVWRARVMCRPRQGYRDSRKCLPDRAG
jgi:hypothetical protein